MHAEQTHPAKKGKCLQITLPNYVQIKDRQQITLPLGEREEFSTGRNHDETREGRVVQGSVTLHKQLPNWMGWGTNAPTANLHQRALSYDQRHNQGMVVRGAARSCPAPEMSGGVPFGCGGA